MYLVSLVLVLSMSWWIDGSQFYNNSCDAFADCPFCKETVTCISPGGDAYALIGDNITLDCYHYSPEDDSYLNSSSYLYFKWTYDNIPLEYQKIISTSILQLNLPITSKNDNEVYVLCSTSIREGFAAQVRLKVDYPPADMSNLTIIVNDWKNMTLKWEPPPYTRPSETNITVIWTAEGAKDKYYCDKGDNTYCFINETSYKDSPEYYFNITVTNTRVDKTHLQSFAVVPTDYAKPRPVENLVVENVTSRSLQLKWSHLRFIRNLTVQVIISSKDSVKKNEGLICLCGDFKEGVDDIPEREAYFNMTVENMEETIEGLHPYTTYQVAVSVKPFYFRGYWSEPAITTITTLEEKPAAGPNVTEGGFYAQNCHGNKRGVTVFLKLPDKEYHYGILTKYSLVYVPSNDRRNISSEPPPENHYDHAILTCNIDYDIYMTVNNSKGSSVNESHLHIPRLGTVPKPDEVIVKLQPNNQNVTEVMWKAPPQATPLSWTVFWCHGTLAFETCQGGISWTEVTDASQSSVILQHFSPSFIYGVSMTTERGSSGLKWMRCIYNVGNDPKYLAKIHSVEDRPNLGLTVMWMLPVCEDYVLITHYIIQYCHGTIKQCDSHNITSNGSEYVIPDLKEGVPYSIRLRQVAVNGKEGNFSDPVIGVPVDKNLKPGSIVGIAFGCAIFLVVVLAGIVCCIRSARRKWKEKVEIEVPSLPITKTMNGHIPSGDSGRGSLSLPSDSPGQSPTSLTSNSRFEPVFEVAEEERKLKKSNFNNKAGQLQPGYALFDMNTSRPLDDEIHSQNENQCSLQEDDREESGGWSSGGCGDSVDPYVTAVKNGDDEDDTSGSTTDNESACKTKGNPENDGEGNSCTDVEEKLIHKKTDSSVLSEHYENGRLQVSL